MHVGVERATLYITYSQHLWSTRTRTITLSGPLSTSVVVQPRSETHGPRRDGDNQKKGRVDVSLVGRLFRNHDECLHPPATTRRPQRALPRLTLTQSRLCPRKNGGNHT